MIFSQSSTCVTFPWWPPSTTQPLPSPTRVQWPSTHPLSAPWNIIYQEHKIVFLGGNLNPENLLKSVITDQSPDNHCVDVLVPTSHPWQAPHLLRIVFDIVAFLVIVFYVFFICPLFLVVVNVFVLISCRCLWCPRFLRYNAFLRSFLTLTTLAILGHFWAIFWC